MKAENTDRLLDRKSLSFFSLHSSTATQHTDHPTVTDLISFSLQLKGASYIASIIYDDVRKCMKSVYTERKFECQSESEWRP